MASLALAFGDAFPPELLEALKASGATHPPSEARKPAPALTLGASVVEKEP